eukprot:6295071-Prymnesium_polylepis.1
MRSCELGSRWSATPSVLLLISRRAAPGMRPRVATTIPRCRVSLSHKLLLALPTSRHQTTSSLARPHPPRRPCAGSESRRSPGKRVRSHVRPNPAAHAAAQRRHPHPWGSSVSSAPRGRQ